MRLTILGFLSLLLIGCVKEEIARSAATIVEMAKAQQHEDADLSVCKRLAEGILILGEAIHETTDKEVKPVVTAEEALVNPDRAVGRAESQAEKLRTAYRFEQLAWDMAWWLGGLAMSALTAVTGIKMAKVIKVWQTAKSVLNQTVSAVQSYREDHPEQKSVIDGYLQAAHDKLGNKAHTYIAHSKVNGIEKIVPKPLDTS